MPFGLRLWPAQLSLIGFACLTLAVLQNVTVDDSVLDAIDFLPWYTIWYIAPNCTYCPIQPDPLKTYNGTWRGATYTPGMGTILPTPSIPMLNFSFTGSAIYIFFILANSGIDSPTATNLSFFLDNVQVGTFLHAPSPLVQYQYNVTVYANDTIPYGPHNMMIMPSNPALNDPQSLMVFDYYIYTTNVTETSSSVPSPTSSSSQTPSASPTMSMSMGNVNIGTISGAVVGVVVAILLVAAGGFLWYRRYKKRKRDLSRSVNQVMIEDSPLPTPVAVPVPFRDTPSPDQQRTQSNRFAKQKSGSRIDVSSPTGSAPNSPSSLATSISPSPSGGAVHGLLEQVELLREEVAHLVRHQRNEEGGSIYEANPLPPPQYSDNTDGTRR